MFTRLFVLVSLLFSFSPSLCAKQSSIDPRKLGVIADLEFVKHVFDLQYAPREWKEFFSNWDLEWEKELARDQIMGLDEVTDEKIREIFHRFLLSCKDYHVGALFFSTERAYLPFRVRSADSRYFIQAINRPHLPESLYPFQKGDEIIAFDGRPVQEVVQGLRKKYCSSNHMLTDQSLAENFLTSREAFRGLQVPRGPVTIEVVRKGESRSRKYQLIWAYIPDAYPGKSRLDNKKGISKAIVSTNDDVIMGTREMYPGFWLGNKKEKENDWTEPLADRIGVLPAFGKVLWKTNSFNPFHAYLYGTPEGRVIGYIRLPVYEGTDLHAEEFGKILSHFEQEAEALVIDQLDNPGGIVLYMYALASMLSEDALATPRHRMAITQKDVRIALWELSLYEGIENDDQAKRFLGYTFGYPASYQLARFYVEHLSFLIDQWNKGKKITDPTYIEGVDHINPHPRFRFTKPILVLVNQLCFSCGDFFPAILQDNHRAVIFGQRTAGAGGAVSTVSFTNESGINELGVTISLAERAGEVPIENLGVVPDISYALTVEDLQNDYAPYINAVNEAVSELIHPSASRGNEEEAHPAPLLSKKKKKPSFSIKE